MAKRTEITIPSTEFGPEHVGELIAFWDGWYIVTGYHTEYATSEGFRRNLRVSVDQYGHLNFESHENVTLMVAD